MRNITGRDQLPVGERRTCPHFIDRLYSSVAKALWPTERDSTALRYITWQYGKCTQTHPFKITLTYLLGRLITAHRMVVKALLNTKRSPFTGFAQAFSVLIVRKSRLLLLKKKTHTAMCTVDYATCVGTSTIRSPTFN